jgi:heme exporter protein D
MIWHDANEFFSMGGNGLYVWGAYGVAVVLMAIEAVVVVLRHRAARLAAAEEAAAAALEAAAGTGRRASAPGARP